MLFLSRMMMHHHDSYLFLLLVSLSFSHKDQKTKTNDVKI